MTSDKICELFLCVSTASFMVLTILRQNSLQEILNLQYEMLKNEIERLDLTNKRIDLLLERVDKLETGNETKL